MARSLERQWEEKLRQAEQIEQDYERRQREQASPLTEADRREILSLGEHLPRVWQAETTTAAERKQIVRLVIQEVALDQKRQRGQVWIRITWLTGVISEHWLRRRVQDYRQYAEREQLEQRVRELNAAQKMDAEIATALNAEGFCSAQGRTFYGALVFLLRKQWQIPTVKINSTYQENPLRWPDGSYSVRGAAAALQISPVTVFIWLRKRRFRAEQMAKGMPWKIRLTDEEITTMRTNTRHVSSSKEEAL